MELIKKTEEFWNDSAKGYSENVQSELRHKERKVWTELILENSPEKECLNVLDIGTGPGFFAIILAQEGHKVTGIDCTEAMLEEARSNAKQEAVSPEFVQMDMHKLDFPDESFDLLVSRNVSWTLLEPMKAYEEWKRVLKPGGRLLIFDANWYMHNFDENIREKFCSGIRQYRKKYGNLPPRFALYRKDEYWKSLPMIGIQRPLWDRAAMWKLGFKDIVSDEDLGPRIELDDIDTMLYGSAAKFMVRGTKPTQDEALRQELLEFWDGYAPACGVGAMRKLQNGNIPCEPIIELFPQNTSKILDVGIGAGELAVMLAKKGYDVTGVDFSAHMLDEADFCSSENGVALTLVLSDADHLPFETGKFDVVLCRNIAWLMPYPEKAIQEWHRVLKPGGRIIIEDKNRYLHYKDERTKSEYAEKWSHRLPDNINLFYGIKHPGASSMDKLAESLPLSFVDRPEWDKSMLKDAGFRIITEKNIQETQEDIETFIICAEK
ncbi:MAG: class I SAM-dependent methyltransferase [Oscillospiraceae bacterium]|jgi:ubiquinone/menaquinone biosynthesis C-methylase UbiE